ncbi:M20/M25/M40 family metallo-hydrolase [Nannocystis bainbridge]|uniref:Vacuolar membrane protease n=1 Tax=Nannocystis bainbridge TaxID=2995303 RepID=A0ABT5E9Q7_9BACT|nr:M20/M25/M40 family metallo-hydrolase [Nannocystis bainbridge]MDC0722592.1 M20/M25/M40 family metallo-hydrolase [Nannocystis bainbridge]
MTAPSERGSELRGAAAFVAAAALLAGALALVQVRLEPPPALGEDVPEDMFSATRALARLERLIGDDLPHPVGSAAAVGLRARMLAEFAALGIDAEVQEGFACGPRSAGCGRVWNVVAALPGIEDGPALLVSAHHDSVAAGPGAGDDGAGVAAVFEVARALLAGPRSRNPIVFVLVDGEESGLLGAQAFVDAHPRAASIGAVINLDAGGTRGVTSLTRTTANDDGLVAAVAEAVPRPYGASVIGAVYGLTPYDTDFTVYKNAGWPALDFGFGEDKAHYHTPLDRLDNLDAASVQHLGDTALAAVRALAGADLAALPGRSRVYVDALGARMLHLRTLWIPGLAALALGLLVPVARRLARESGGDRRSWLRRGLGFAALVGLPAAIGAGWMAAIAWLTAAEVAGHAAPLPARVALWTIVLATGGALVGPLARADAAARAWLWLGPWLWLAAIAAITAVALPGASVGVLPPALVAGMLAFWTCFLGNARKSMSWRTWPSGPVILLGLALPALMWLQAAVRVEAVFGLEPAAAGVLALLASLLAPLWHGLGRLRRPLVLALAVACAVATAIAVTSPAYSEARPRRLSLLYHLDADSGAGRWIVGADAPLPAALQAAAAFGPAGPAFAWDSDASPSFVAPDGSSPPGLSPPTVEPEADPEPPPGAGRRVVVRVRSTRGARVMAMFVPAAAGLRSVAMNGVVLPPYPEHRRKYVEGGEVYGIVAPPPEGVVVTLELDSAAAVEAVVWDLSEGLPAAGDALKAARPTWAVPSHGGDRTMVSRQISL